MGTFTICRSTLYITSEYLCDHIKIERTGHVARMTNEKWIRHAVGYTQDKMQRNRHTRFDVVCTVHHPTICI